MLTEVESRYQNNTLPRGARSAPLIQFSLNTFILLVMIVAGLILQDILNNFIQRMKSCYNRYYILLSIIAGVQTCQVSSNLIHSMKLQEACFLVTGFIATALN